MAKLFLVPTPIGNLQDVSFRTLETLKEVDFILAEDTRKTTRLLQQFDISNKLIPHHKFNEHKTLEGMVNRLLEGDRKSTRLNSSHTDISRMPSSA